MLTVILEQSSFLDETIHSDAPKNTTNRWNPKNCSSKSQEFKKRETGDKNLNGRVGPNMSVLPQV
jgi:hypothetical protein